jgi:hypothetical protein
MSDYGSILFANPIPGSPWRIVNRLNKASRKRSGSTSARQLPPNGSRLPF